MAETVVTENGEGGDATRRDFIHIAAGAAAVGAGAMNGVSYIQRVNTKGGVAPTAVCDAGSASKRMTVAYEADYVFYGM